MTSAQVSEVFDYWRERLHPKALRSKARDTKVRARLAEGYSVAQLCRAVDGCAGSSWHRARGHTDLVLICRDAPHVDRFLAWAESDDRMDAVQKVAEDRARWRADDGG